MTVPFDGNEPGTGNQGGQVAPLVERNDAITASMKD
jgi:hypothetical protein